MQQSLMSIVPEILLVFFGLFLIVINVIASEDNKASVGYFGVAFIVLILLLVIPTGSTVFGFGKMIVWDRFAYMFFLIFSIAFVLSILGSVNYVDRNFSNKGEYYLIMFFSVIGMTFMVSAIDLSIFYLGMETMAISMYILSGYEKNNVKSNEAGIKYFIIGAFSSAIFLFGLSYVFGYTGTTRYYDIARIIVENGLDSFNIKVGLILMLVGFSFKITAFPFHMWAPDVYTGAPTPVTGFMTVAPKAAAFGGLIRFVWIAMEPAQFQWQLFFAILAVLTMTYGNLVALVQNNVKRMLAYSAISHAGYMLIGLVAANELGYQAIAMYMVIYGFMNIGAFTILSVMVSRGILESERLESFSGLAKKHPLISLSMLIFMFSLAGIPPLAGFIGKFYIFAAAIKSGFVWLAIIGIVNSAVACYYYIRIVIFMYFKEPEHEVVAEGGYVPMLGVFLSAVFVIIIGIFPECLVSLAKSIIVH